MIDNEYLLGGLINIISQRYISIIKTSKIKRGWLENWIAFLLVYKVKRLEIISMCRIRVLLESNGVCSSLVQYQLVDGKVSIAKDYNKEIFDDIRKYIRVNEEIDNIIIARDYNQYVADKEVQKFNNEIGVKEIHVHVYKIRSQ